MSSVFYKFLKNKFLCNSQGHNSWIFLICSFVPYHLCFLKLYCGYFLSAISIIRWSLETFAIIEAIEISETFKSPFTMVLVFIFKSFSIQKSCFQSIIISDIGFVWDIVCIKLLKFAIEKSSCKKFSMENLFIKSQLQSHFDKEYCKKFWYN